VPLHAEFPVATVDRSIAGGRGGRWDVTARRLWRGYTVLAVQACSALLFLVLVNVIAWGILWLKDQRSDAQRLPASFTELESRLGPAWVSALYPGWDQSNLSRLYAEWMRVRFDYEPFTQFTVHPMRGAYMNVSEHGFRSNGGDAPWPPDAAALNVFVFGGSTTFGAMLPDAQTIPAALEARLRTAGCAPAVHVYNFARPGFIAPQASALFEQLLRAGAVPQVAVFVEGINESVWQGSDPQYTDRLTDMVDQINSAQGGPGWSARARDLLVSLPITRLAGLVMQRMRRPGDTAAAPQFGAGRRVETDDVLRRWIGNKRLRDAVADAFGVKALTVWQPSPTYHYDLRHHLFAPALQQWGAPGPSVMEQSRAMYAAADAGRRDPDVQRDFLWLGDLQRDRVENFYVDSLHYTGAFSAEIAAAIFDELARCGWITCATR
jgi:hypothetical protein